MREYLSAPILVDISTTNRCNMRCKYCYASSSPEEDKYSELSKDEFTNLFNELDKMRVHRISLSGGEPFIRNDFFDILSSASKCHFAIVINTNGSLITDSIAYELKKYRFDRICVTVDGSQAEIHDKMRGSGSFVKAINGINLLQKHGLPVSTLFTLNKFNVHDLIPTIQLNHMMGIKHMSVMIVCPTGRASDGETLVDKNSWYPVFYELTKMKAENRMPLSFKIVPPNESSVFWHFYLPLEFYGRLDLLKVWKQDLNGFSDAERTISCTAGIRSASVASNGDIYGCDLMTGIEELKAGNLREQSFADIWNNSSVFQKLRELSFESLSGPCKNCKYSWCGGGCRSSAYNLNNTINASDSSCFYAKEMTN